MRSVLLYRDVMTKMRGFLALLLLSLSLVFGASSPAFADSCGDVQASWVPTLTASAWDTELYFTATSVDETSVIVETYAGQASVSTGVLPNVQILTGTWSFTDSVFAWSGTDTLDNTYRLTAIMTADSCGGLGGVHSASGVLLQQGVGEVGVVYMTRIL